MPRWRRAIRRIAPKLAADIEAESKTWMVKCPSCDFEISVWDAGGVRYKARGTPRRLMRCPQCQAFRMMRVYRAHT